MISRIVVGISRRKQRVREDLVQSKSILWELVRYNLQRRPVPPTLQLELTNICTANCIFCAYQHNRQKKAILSDDYFNRAVEEYHGMGGRHISQTPMQGEILVDPQALERLEYIRNRKFERISFYTNLNLLHKYDVGRFLKSGVTELRISTAPPDEELYGRIFRNGDYRQVRNNIRGLLVKFNGQEDKTVRFIEISFRSDRPLDQCVSLPDYKTYIEPHLGLNVEVTAMTTFDSWNGAIKQADLLPGMEIKDANFPKRFPCRRIFVLQCTPHGDLRLCGCRYDPNAEEDELLVGSLRTGTIAQAYRSKKARKIINSFQCGRPPAVCQKCSWYC